MALHPIVEQLRDARVGRDLSLNDVAVAAGRYNGWGRGSIWKWENGVGHPSLASLDEWAQALGFEIALNPAEGAP
jgi:transcriptional regulator with XRE-family HTH domain